MTQEMQISTATVKLSLWILLVASAHLSIKSIGYRVNAKVSSRIMKPIAFAALFQLLIDCSVEKVMKSEE